MKPKIKEDAKRGLRIALYIRVSTEEQASNPEGSIKSQEQRLRTLIDLKNQESLFGEVAAVFIDRARSGKDTNRPELQRLLECIRNREINMVMVTELSRLSRSIKDFCDIWELMRSYGCGFQSLREQFDTTTAAGEMVLYTIANIAQFERKQTSERISANFRARAERGLKNGGSIAFGYLPHPEKKGYLVPNDEDVAIVREAFATFIREGCLSQTAKSLNERGYQLTRRKQGGKPRLGHFNGLNLHKMLTNRAYLGLRIYNIKGEEKAAKAVWPAIIEEDTFQEVQKILTVTAKKRRSKYLNGQRFPFLLSGLVTCGTCGDRLPGKSAHGNGGKIPYYEHCREVKRQACLTRKFFVDHQPSRVLAAKIEGEVWNRVLALFEDPTLAKSIIEEAQKIHETKNRTQEAQRLKSKIRGIEEQGDALAEHLSKIPKNLSPAPIFAQMERLEQLKAQTQEALNEILRSPFTSEMPAQLTDYSALIESLRGMLSGGAVDELRPKIVQRLVHKVEVLSEGYRIHYHVAKRHVLPAPWEPGFKVIGAGSALSSDGGSKIVLTGGPSWDRTNNPQIRKLKRRFYRRFSKPSKEDLFQTKPKT